MSYFDLWEPDARDAPYALSPSLLIILNTGCANQSLHPGCPAKAVTPTKTSAKAQSILCASLTAVVSRNPASL
jgi:hypothetical protein